MPDPVLIGVVPFSPACYMIAGTGPKTLLETMTQREQQRDELVEALKREETLQKQRSQFNAQALETWLNQTLPQLERLLSESVEQAREVLHALLAEPLTIGPIFQAHGGVKGKTIPRYVLSGTTTLGAVFRKINSTSPTKPNYPEPKCGVAVRLSQPINQEKKRDKPGFIGQ